MITLIDSNGVEYIGGDLNGTFTIASDGVQIGALTLNGRHSVHIEGQDIVLTPSPYKFEITVGGGSDDAEEVRQ